MRKVYGVFFRPRWGKGGHFCPPEYPKVKVVCHYVDSYFCPVRKDRYYLVEIRRDHPPIVSSGSRVNPVIGGGLPSFRCGVTIVTYSTLLVMVP